MTTPAQSKATKSGRMYNQDPGIDVPSHTNVAGILGKPQLVPGSRKIQAEVILDNLDYYVALVESVGFAKARLEASRTAKKVWDDRADEGTRVHAAIADMIAGRHDQIPSDLGAYMEQLDKWLYANTPRFVLSEVTVHNRTHRIAGTIDQIFWLDHEDGSELVLSDTKTGGLWPEVALQLSAAENAEFIRFDDGREEPMPKVDRCAVLHLTPEKCELIPVKTGPETWEAFLALRRVWSWVHETAPKVLP